MGKLFKKNETEEITNDQVIVLAKNIRVRGSIEAAQNPVLVNGIVEGDVITSGRVVVGITGDVGGNVTAAELEVHGIVRGEMRARAIHLSPRPNGEMWELLVPQRKLLIEPVLAEIKQPQPTVEKEEQPPQADAESAQSQDPDSANHGTKKRNK